MLHTPHSALAAVAQATLVPDHGGWFKPCFAPPTSPSPFRMKEEPACPGRTDRFVTASPLSE